MVLSFSSLSFSTDANRLCVFCVGPLCGPPLWWRVLCGAFPSVWVPCGWDPPLSCSRFPWHLFLALPLARAHTLTPHTLAVELLTRVNPSGTPTTTTTTTTTDPFTPCFFLVRNTHHHYY